MKEQSARERRVDMIGNMGQHAGKWYGGAAFLGHVGSVEAVKAVSPHNPLLLAQRGCLARSHHQVAL